MVKKTRVSAVELKIKTLDANLHGRVRVSVGRVDSVGTEAGGAGTGDGNQRAGRGRSSGVVLLQLLLKGKLASGQDLVGKG